MHTKPMLLYLAMLLAAVFSFRTHVTLRPLHRCSPLHMSTVDKLLNIIGKDVEITDSLRESINKKIGHNIMKLGLNHMIQKVDVTLKADKYDVTQRHTQTTKNQRCSVNLFLHDKQTLSVSQESNDMYYSITNAAHKVQEALIRHKTKINQKKGQEKLGVALLPREE